MERRKMGRNEWVEAFVSITNQVMETNQGMERNQGTETNKVTERDKEKPTAVAWWPQQN